MKHSLARTLLLDFITFVVDRAMRLRLSVHVSGLEEIPLGEPFVLASNHVSYFDGPLLCCLTSRRRALHPVPILTRGLMRFPISIAFRIQGAITIDRHNPSARRNFEGLERAAERLAELPVLIFPEGGVSRATAVRTARPGVGWLLAHSQCPLVLAHIRHSSAGGRKRVDVVFRRVAVEASVRFSKDFKETAQWVSQEIREIPFPAITGAGS